MRQSAAVLGDTQVRLADLHFPTTRVHVHRTRLAYIHIENLLHFSKADRDGRVDGYITSYLPDEVAILLLRGGELVTAVAIMEDRREVQPIPVVLSRMKDELERGELVFCEAPMEQLVWMYASCANPLRRHPVHAGNPGALFKAVRHERVTGVLEFISDGRVTYLQFADGEYRAGHFCEKDEQEAVPRYIEGLFANHPDGSRPVLAASIFEVPADIAAQAAPERVAKYRTLFWRIADAAETAVEGEALKRVEKLRNKVAGEHPSLAVIGAARDGDPDPVVVTPEELTAGLADWSQALLDELEVIAPGVAPSILKDATREYRFVLQKVGFYDRFPWSVEW